MEHRDSEIDLISAIINYQLLNPVVISKVTDKCFKGYKSVFKGILDHYKKYQKLPDKSTLAKKYDFTVEKTPEKIEYYIDMLKSDYKKSLVIDMIVEANELVATRPDDVLGLFGKTSKEISGLFLDDEYYNMGENSNDRWKFYESLWDSGGILGFPFPYEALNNVTMGIQKEQLITIAGVPKSGKTWLALIMLAYLWVNHGVRVYIRSEEMSKELMSLRIDSAISRIFYSRIKKGNITPAEKKHLKDIVFQSRKDFYISRPRGEDSLDNIRMEIDRFRPDIVLVDSSYLIIGGVSKSKGDWVDIKEVTKGLKRVAGEYALPLLNTTQLSKAGYLKSQRQTPGAEVVSYKSYVEDSDLIIVIHETKEDRKKRIKRISINASRESDVLSFAVNWSFKDMDFSEIAGTVETTSDEDEEDEEEKTDKVSKKNVRGKKVSVDESKK